TGRNLVLKFEGNYPGQGGSLVIKAGWGVATSRLPDSPGVPGGLAKNTITARYNASARVNEALRQYADDIAAVIVEPVSGNMGVVPPIESFLQDLRDITADNGSLLIFDEVMTGFRVGYHCAQGYFNVKPDLTCLGKVIGGGLPVGAYGGKREIMESVAPAGSIYQAGTLSGNPLAMTAGYETLSALEPATYDVINEKVDKLIAGYEAAAKANDIPLQVNRAGSMVGFFF